MRRAKGTGRIFKPKNSNSFFFRIIREGEQIQKRVVNPKTGIPATSKMEAQRLVDSHLEYFCSSSNKFNGKEPGDNRSNLTILFDSYWESFSSTWSVKRRNEFNRRRELFENRFKSIDDITHERLGAFVEDRKHDIPTRYRGMSKKILKDTPKYKNLVAGKIPNVTMSTVIKELGELRAVLNWAMKTRRITHNPFYGFRLPKEEEHRRRILSEDEMKSLLTALENPDFERIRLIILIALFCGMRRGEITNLEWADIHFDRGLIRLTRTKTKEPRDVPFNDVIEQEILRLRDKSESKYLFPSPESLDKPVVDIKKIFLRLLRTAGIENFRFHDLRHTCATNMLANEANIRYVQLILGHASILTTQKYLNPDFLSIQEAVKSYGDKWLKKK